jgi:hypothetical protein
VQRRDRLIDVLARSRRLRRFSVAFCVIVVIVAIVVRYPQTFGDANRTARANAASDYLDREIGGGNSVLPSQWVAIEARARIAPGETFTVAVGEPEESWSELATPDALDGYLRYFLLPRRPRADALWVICFACDRAEYPEAVVVWEDDEGLSILRRPT